MKTTELNTNGYPAHNVGTDSLEPRLRTLLAPGQMRASAREAEAELLRDIIPVDDTDAVEVAQAEFALYLNGYGNKTLADVRARYETILAFEFKAWEAQMSLKA